MGASYKINGHRNHNVWLSTKKPKVIVITGVALGALVSLIGVFLILGAFQVLPFSINVISRWDLLLSGGALGLGVLCIGLSLGYGVVHRLRHSQTVLVSKKVQVSQSEEDEADPTDRTESSSSLSEEVELSPIKIAKTHIDDFMKFRPNNDIDSSCATNVTFFYYNCDGFDDTGWGCAWRCIETCASALGLAPSFQKLFSKYRLTKNPNEWAEPGYGKRYFDDVGIESELVFYRSNGTSKTPLDQWSKINDFTELRDMMLDHFKNHHTPLMIDDKTYTYNIIGIRKVPQSETVITQVNEEDSSENEEDLSDTILLIGDPHKSSGESGLYYVVLDANGKKLATTGVDDGKNGLKTAQHLHFNDKGWILLFPKRKT